jgi:hypothetical protein
MGRLNCDKGQLIYSFCLDELVPDDHLVRAIASVLGLSWVHKKNLHATIPLWLVLRLIRF